MDCGVGEKNSGPKWTEDWKKRHSEKRKIIKKRGGKELKLACEPQMAVNKKI